jgi:hypothetical protein
MLHLPPCFLLPRLVLLALAGHPPSPPPLLDAVTLGTARARVDA